MKPRFQIKLAGNEIVRSPETGKIVGWRLEFLSCQPGATAILLGGALEAPLKEGIRIPKDSPVKIVFKGEVTATVVLTLVMEQETP